MRPARDVCRHDTRLNFLNSFSDWPGGARDPIGTPSNMAHNTRQNSGYARRPRSGWVSTGICNAGCRQSDKAEHQSRLSAFFTLG
jgi:hypothetical protein